jgi:hypothetical protein
MRVRLAAAIVTGVVVVVVVSVVAGREAGHSAAAVSPPLTEAQVAADCVRLYHELNGASSAEPAPRFVVRNGDRQLRVYVSEPDNWISVCRAGRSGADEVYGTVMEKGRPDRIQFFGGADTVLKARVLLGRLPTGATTIKARLSSGQTVTGTRDGDIFLVWSPDGAVDGARLTAFRPDGSVAATAAAPGLGS